MRDRLLIRHFLWRFLDNDLISPNADRHVVLSALGGGLAAVSLFMAVLIASPYQFNPLMPPGIVSLSSLDDRFLFTAASMLTMALVAVAQWDSLMLDARDTAALGTLPIPRAVIVRTKFMAVAVLAIGVAGAWNLAPTLLRFAAVPSRLGVTLTGSLILTMAHGVTTVAAGAFGFLAVFGLREVTFAVVGPARFWRISAALQAALVVALVTAVLLLPGAHTNVARKWLAPGGPMASAFPPLWFVGLHETLAGSTIDRLPRGYAERTLVVPSAAVQKPGGTTRVLEMRRRAELAERRRTAAERDATELYRSQWPLYHQLALTASAALAIAGILTIVASIWNSRQLPIPVVHRAHVAGPAGRAWQWIVTHAVARSALHQAGFFFTVQTLSRQIAHRVALAASLAVGLSLILITARARLLVAGNDVASIPLAILAGQSLVIASVLSGFRHAVRLPAQLRAGSTFSLAWTGKAAPYLAGVKLAGWVALVLPILGGLCVWHAAVLGGRLALLHLGVGIALSLLLMETLFLRYRGVPFASSYVPSGEMRSRGIAYVVVLVSLSWLLAWVERFSLTTPQRYATLMVILIGLSAVVIAFDRGWRRPLILVDVDEPPMLPTQRFDLAR